MRTLSDTLARISALQKRQFPQFEMAGLPGRLSSLPEFGSNPGALGAKFYCPDDLPAGAPLVVVLHGCTQNAAGYDHHSGWSDLADKSGFALLYPEQQRSNNPNLCFNWFQPADVRRGEGEVHSIWQMIEAMVTSHGLDRDRVFITGLSAGGAMAAAMLATYPQVFAGGAIIAGLAYGSASTVPEAFDRMRGHGGPGDEDLQQLLRRASPHSGPWPRISIWHGTADKTVDRSNAVALAEQWRAVHPGVQSQWRNTGKNARQVWTDASGEPVIEVNMIAGMGHGTPIDRDRLGSPGPFMLDVGVSSTHEIAGFWNIAEPSASAAARPAPETVATAPDRAAGPELRAPSMARPAWMGERAEGSGHQFAPSGVRGIIEKALRAAGLMR